MLLKGAYCVGEHFVDPHGSYLSRTDSHSEIGFIGKWVLYGSSVQIVKR